MLATNQDFPSFEKLLLWKYNSSLFLFWASISTDNLWVLFPLSIILFLPSTVVVFSLINLFWSFPDILTEILFRYQSQWAKDQGSTTSMIALLRYYLWKICFKLFFSLWNTNFSDVCVTSERSFFRSYIILRTQKKTGQKLDLWLLLFSISTVI